MIQTIENIALAALSSLETCRMTDAIVRQVLAEGIPGDLVECGVYAGSQSAIMARALVDHRDYCFWKEGMPAPRKMEAQGRRVHLFDSFEGCPDPGPKDLEFREAGHRKGQASCTLQGVKANMKQWGIPEDLLVYHPGWFIDTVSWHAGFRRRADRPPQKKYKVDVDEQIAVLRLDADLYDSTLICMECLYPLLSPGGFLIVDDYALSGARQAVEDYFDRNGGRSPLYMRRP